MPSNDATEPSDQIYAPTLQGCWTSVLLIAVGLLSSEGSQTGEQPSSGSCASASPV